MKIYNTLSGRKEDFIPQGDTVKMYVCGVTPYAPSHLGHAMSYIVFDTIRRYLEFRGYKVKYVQNFTDIDDKIIARANESGISAKELAQRFIDQYFADMDALNIKRADIYPRATEEIPKIIEVIEGLLTKRACLSGRRRCLFQGEQRPRLRQAQPSHPGWHDGRRPRRDRRSQGASSGFRPVESS